MAASEETNKGLVNVSGRFVGAVGLPGKWSGEVAKTGSPGRVGAAELSWGVNPEGSAMVMAASEGARGDLGMSHLQTLPCLRMAPVLSGGGVNGAAALFCPAKCAVEGWRKWG